jgi:peptidyl-prolyl cis-trans isomerase B (cyclophilin B)
MKKFTSLILALAMIFVCVASLASCEKMGEGASAYLDSRDVSGRDIKYVEICVKDYGKMVVLLDATTAPKTVENFINLANSGFYDGLTFHRIIDGFMVQGGDPDADGSGGSENEIFGEFASNGHANDIKHLRGVISMARTGGDPNSASSQFFICHDDAAHLDGDYAAFGYVVEGISVVDDIVRSTMDKCMNYYGNSFAYWYYYGNGALIDNYGKPAKELQPTIKYVKALDSWEK